jgi:LmbE family N-acetylglucosaminyl deacetylase
VQALPGNATTGWSRPGNEHLNAKRRTGLAGGQIGLAAGWLAWWDMDTANMRCLFIHAHYDDYEFTSAGTFERMRRVHGRDWAARVVVCTDGAAGHHRLTRAATARVRRVEQEASAGLGGYEFELLRLPGGGVPREGCIRVDGDFLAALWRSIRAFEPDYIFCPPLPADPLAGVHVDHLAVAEGVRRVAYLINVPHAFTPEYPAKGRRSQACKVPVILNTYDGYMHGANAYDLVIDVEATFELVCRLTWCHQSQICEWLPWVGRHRMEPPASVEEWSGALRRRFLRRQRELGIRGSRFREVFGVTAWGEVPTLEQLRRDFPGFEGVRSLKRLGERLRCWRGE